MCGIFGCVGRITEADAYKCINQISYRGPDGQYVNQLNDVTLAHARLSIIDISEVSNQPMQDFSGRYWITYNGEIYNYIELRKELESLGCQFRTDSDTEVVLYAYIVWGKDFQNKCNGMWSIAIWDSLNKTLFLSRDRFGVKPLYYYQQDGNFYFASEMKAFFPIMKEKKINYEIFAKKSYFLYEATEQCCIQKIKKVPAGCYGYFENEKIEIYRWWNTLEHLIQIPDRYEEQVELLKELFLDACKIRMRSDVPIGTALSGGVDSSAVIGAMKHISEAGMQYINKDWQHVFVASMPGTIIDETEYAEWAAKYAGVNIQKVMVSSRISAEEFLKYMYICEDPYITSPIPFMQTYKSISDSGIKVTLDGHGADELFGGYYHDVFFAAIEAGNDRKEIEQIWETYNNIILPEGRMTFEQFIQNLDYIKRCDNLTSNGLQDMGIFNKRLYMQTHYEALPTLLRCYDRYSMGNGLEIRMPFLDYRIVSFAFSIPWKSKINHGYTKKIVRDMASCFMDKRVMYRKSKIGFNTPITEWLQGDMKEFILDMVHSKEFYECELINPLDITIQVSEFYKCKRTKFKEGDAIWNALVPFLWKTAMQL